MDNRELTQKRFLEEMKRADLTILRLMGLHFLAAIIVMPIGNDTRLLGLVGGAVISGTAFLIYRLYAGDLVCRLAMGILMMAYSALFIQQTGGMIETHFHIFGSMAFLLIYRDWRVILAAVSTVAVHHILFAVLQYNEVSIFGAPIIVFNYGCSVTIVVIHACWALFEAIILAHYSRKQYINFIANINFTEQMKFLAANPDYLSQRFRTVTERSEEKAFLGPVNEFIAEMHRVMKETGESSSLLGGCTQRLLGTSEQMNQLAVTLDERAESTSSSVKSMAATVRETASSARETSKGMQAAAETAQNMAADSEIVSRNAEEVSNNITMVVSAVHELENSIGEVAANCVQVADASAEGNRRTKEAGEQIASLNEGAGKIGDVVNLIRQIAAHTNLLALNSTIEAASAGEAGKGFAVVAQEIKTLAKQTADATDEIAQQVEKIQKDSDNSRLMMEQVAGMIEELSNLTNNIAAAVEQQSASTSEIASSINSGAEATRELNQRIRSIDSGSRALADNIGTVAASAVEIAGAMNHISGLAERFGKDSEAVGAIAHNTAESSALVKKEAGGMTDLSKGLAENVARYQLAREPEAVSAA